MVDLYSFFLLTDISYIEKNDYFMNMLCSVLNSHIKELNKGVTNLSKDSILNLMKKEELVADVLQTAILFSSYSYAEYLSNNKYLSENDKATVKEIVNFTFNNFKEKNPDKNTFEAFLKMG